MNSQVFLCGKPLDAFAAPVWQRILLMQSGRLGHREISAGRSEGKWGKGSPTCYRAVIRGKYGVINGDF